MRARLTRRLALRPFRNSEAATLAALLRDEAVIRWMPGAPLKCDEQTASRLIVHAEKAMARGLGINWAITRRDDGALLGEITLDLRSGELSFWLGTAFWGVGYAREAVNGMLEEVAAVAPGATVVAYAHRSNVRSVRLLEHCGFQFKGLRLDHPRRKGHPMLEYQLVAG